MKKICSIVIAVLLIAAVFSAISVTAFAEPADEVVTTGEAESAADNTTGTKALSAGILIAIAAAVGAAAMSFAIAKAMDGIARQPEANGSIRTTLMLGLVFIETVVIYALIVAILIVFVL